MIMSKMDLQKYFLPGIVCIAGLLMIFWPAATIHWVCRITGILLVLSGINTLLEGRRLPGDRSASVALSVLEIIGGALLVFRSEQVVSILPTLLGIMLLVAGAVMLYGVLSTKADTLHILITALIPVIGVLLMINPFGAVKVCCVIAGIGLVYTGVTYILDNR